MKRNWNQIGVHKRIVIVTAVLIICLFTTTLLAAEPTPTGEIRIAVSVLGNETMDPVLTSDGAKPMMTPFYDSMVGVDSNGKLSKETGVARDWELSPDAMKLTLRIRKGIKFHNGDDLTAEDVKFSIEQFKSERCVSSQVDTFRKLVKNMETPDPYTVVIYLNQPCVTLANFLSRQMGVEFSVLPKKYFEKVGADYFNAHPVGSGPFRFVEHKIGNQIIYEAVNYPHWLVGVPKIKKLTFYIVKEESTRTAMLKKGEVDVAEISRDRVKEVPNCIPYEKKGYSILGMYINNTWETDSFLGNEKFREALSLAISREEIRDYVFGGKAQVTGAGMVYGSYALSYKPLPLPKYDPKRAKQLVGEAFPGRTPELKLYVFPLGGVPELQRVGEAIAGYWDKIGVKTKIIPTEYPAYRKMLAKPNSPELRNSLAIMRYGNRPLWEAAFEVAYHSKGMLTQVHNPDVDRMIQKLFDENDPLKLGPQYYNLAVYLNKYYYQIPIVEVGAIWAADPKKVPKWPNLSAPLGYDLYLEDLYRR